MNTTSNTITNFKQKSKTVKAHAFFKAVKASALFSCSFRQCGIFWTNYRDTVLVGDCRSHSRRKLFFDVPSCCTPCRFCCDQHIRKFSNEMKFVVESLRCFHFTQSAKSACILCAVYGAHFLQYIVGQNVVVMPSNHTSNWKFQSHQVLPAISENANTVSN